MSPTAAVAVYNPGGSAVVVDAAGRMVEAGRFAAADRDVVANRLTTGRLVEVADPREGDAAAELDPEARAVLDAVAKANGRKAAAASKAKATPAKAAAAEAEATADAADPQE